MKIISFCIISDKQFEVGKTFFINLYDVVNVAIANSRGIPTSINDYS
ncbi:MULTISPECIES: hypothetical protein [Nostoc]|uniref:Uncharacterized protein n=1 Tax=Nostoc paludosum FACHB-159 TaxID=2692908 RepID=A0ABR8KI26_9NOSO|nr:MULTISPECIES: hypothetical protein [Nostoc]MBD2682120.1 hypothetical protein [Nostoc sp. FACHB-857]MBD2738461.1 hypothetical protein [Nostoc paludosum FACHB-159]